MSLSPGHRARLTSESKVHFQSDSLMDALAREVCDAGCLPRKEFFESWEVAKRVSREVKGRRVVDLAAGHGLLGAMLLLLDKNVKEARCVDTRIPKCARELKRTLALRWPFLDEKWVFEEQKIENVALHADDFVVSVHACGALTDVVLARAIAHRASVAVLPCCHALGPMEEQRFTSWTDSALAIDMRRAIALEAAGYTIKTRTIPEEITPKNRLLIGLPHAEKPA